MNNQPTYVMLSPIEDFLYLFNNVVFGESSVEDLLLLVGTLVAFVAFILWCCFPVRPQDIHCVDSPKNSNEEEKYNQQVMEHDYVHS